MAQAPELLTRLAPGPGSDAGEVDNPRSVAPDPTTGHVYVSDLNNARIDEYTAWGEFVRAWGWGVADGASEALQSCGPKAEPPTEACFKGVAGSGAGQFFNPGGMALDEEGNVYVAELNNRRVQKFSHEGAFLLMFGGEVNETTGGNLCTAASGDVCKAGVSSTEPAHFEWTGLFDLIAYSPAADAIVVGDKERIQVFETNGTYREEFNLKALDEDLFKEKYVAALDVDAAGNMYFSAKSKTFADPFVEDVFKLNAAGEALAPGIPGASAFKVKTPTGVALDVEGNVWAIEADTSPSRLLKYSAAGSRLVPTANEEGDGEFFPYLISSIPLNGIATGFCSGSEEPGNLYVAAFFPSLGSYVDAFGTPPIGCEPPPERPPHIFDQYALEAGPESVRLRAEINPRFWADTSYRVQYATAQCIEAGGWEAPCVEESESELLTEAVIDTRLKTRAVTIAGLQADTAYRFRFVAESTGGGPVFGKGGGKPEEGDGFRETGEEAAFATFRAPAEKAPCPNDEHRGGPAVQLPDCRAYEMISPIDKNNADVGLFEGQHAIFPLFFEIDQSSPGGRRFTFSSVGATFGDAESAPNVSQHLAERGPEGWSSEPISPPRTLSPVPGLNLFAGEFQIFSPDLCTAWLRHYSVDPLDEFAIPKYTNAYKRRNCGGNPLYEALTTVKPIDRDAEDYTSQRVLGTSADNSRALLAAPGRLHKDAPSLVDPELLLYEHGPEGLRFVCYLPGGAPSPEACAAGSAVGGGHTNAHNAISADGETIFWTAYVDPSRAGPKPGRAGQIYARLGGKETLALSGAVSEDPAWYWTAAKDGSRAIFAFDSGAHAEELYEFDLGAKEAHPIAEEVDGPMGASEDAKVLYFSSRADLDGGGPAQEGDRNLYRYEGGTYRYLMALVGSDINGGTADPKAIDEYPTQRQASVSPDGGVAVFPSIVSPTPQGYENLNPDGEAVQELYRYDATANGGEGELRCISCNPSGVRAAAQNLGASEKYWVAAKIQGWEALGHTPRTLSADGSRVFFESIEALVPRDTNATWDVYQWEKPGKGTCKTTDPTYGELSGGCVDLISSGRSPARSVFLDANRDGSSVFFGTQSSLVGQDPGLNDIYVARVGGGFPEPDEPGECEGDACANPPSNPEPLTPASSTFVGPEGVPGERATPCTRLARKARQGARAAGRLRRAAKRSARAKHRARARRQRSAARRRARAAGRLSTRAKRCRRAARRRAGR